MRQGSYRWCLSLCNSDLSQSRSTACSEWGRGPVEETAHSDVAKTWVVYDTQPGRQKCMQRMIGLSSASSSCISPLQSALFTKFFVSFTANKFPHEASQWHLCGLSEEMNPACGPLQPRKWTKWAARVAHPPLWKLTWGAWNTGWISDTDDNWGITIQRLFQLFIPSHASCSLLSRPSQPSFCSSLPLPSHPIPFLCSHLIPPNTIPPRSTAPASLFNSCL